MKVELFSKLAITNILKSRKLYIPHILTGSGLTAIYYIIYTLSQDETLSKVRGGDYITTVMGLGVNVIAFISVILMLYTNSFLMKQRKKEFGLYNILGMEKRHVGIVLFFETFFSGVMAIILGIILGIVLYKLCVILICNILKVDTILGFDHISFKTIVPVALFFAIIYAATYLFNRIHIARMKLVELIKSDHLGEKEPKVKWITFMLGIIAIAIGYYIAISTDNPLEAVSMFFVAVILVIIGTYFLFIAGSIALLKMLKKNRKYYYKKKHMISVSGLLYRMKQNAVGLASISILATAVMVMVSSTLSLYAGINDSLNKQYPNHLVYSACLKDEAGGENENINPELLHSFITKAAEDNGVEIKKIAEKRYLESAYLFYNGEFSTDQSLLNFGAASGKLGDLIVACFVTADEYEKQTGRSISLAKDEVAICQLSDSKIDFGKEFKLASTRFKIVEEIDDYEFPISMSDMLLFNCYGIVVSDEDVFQMIYEDQKKVYGENASEIDSIFEIDFADENKAKQKNDAMYENVCAMVANYKEESNSEKGTYMVNWESRFEAEENFYVINGSLLFLGLLLTFVFLFATALIIYYKQISEGYEDRKRFQIMQKVGMSSDEVKSAIHSQILIIFFLPVIVAGIHLSAAYPMLSKLLKILFLPNNLLFIGCALAAFFIFVVIYVIIYMMTAKIYYEIVH